MKLYVVFMAVIGMVASQTTNSPVAETADSCKTNVYHVQSLTQTNTCCSNKTISQQGAAIEDLKAQVASLQAKIQALESQKHNLSFYISLCESESGLSRMTNTVFLQSLRTAKWPNDAFCQAISASDPGNSGTYEITAEVMTSRAARAVSSGVGHVGFMFNVVDEHNYDQFYFSTHSVGSCYTHSYIENGVLHHKSNGRCPQGNPKRLTWFKAKIEVHSSSRATIRYNDGFVANITPHFPLNRQGGVIVPNSEGVLSMFRKYKLTPTSASKPKTT